MPTVLLCSAVDLTAELRDTAICRDGVERQRATRAEEALSLAAQLRPKLVVIDRDLPRASDVVGGLRADAGTRQLSVVVAARGEFSPTEVDLLEAGANAILRLPANADWDERLVRLLTVPVRRDARFHVSLDVLAVGGGHSGSGVALNLSVSGVLIETGASLSMGDDVFLEFSLPGSLGQVRVGGRVVRMARADRFGIEFLEFQGEGRAQVAQFVEALGAFSFGV